MEPEESLPEMEDMVEVLEDPTIALAWKINSMTQQKRVKAKAAKEETLKKQADDEGRAGERARRG